LRYRELSNRLGSTVVIRIGIALAVVAGAAALVPLVGAAGRSDEPPAARVAALEPVALTPDAVALRACLGQKGARQAAGCVGHVAEGCLKAGVGDRGECYRRETDGWSHLLEDYRGRIEKRLATDPRRLAEIREGQRAWIADQARRCDVPAPADAAVCTMRESGRRVIQLRLLADQTGAHL